MRAVTLILIGACLCAGAGLAQSASKYYKNDRWGYKLRVPGGWKQAALSASEEWIASKHIATRLLYAKKSDFLEADYPQMWVIGFPHKRQEERGAKVDTKDGNIKITFKNPYKDYKDFVKRERWFVGGGYYFSKEEEGTHAGMNVTKYEIKVEKMVSSPYRIVAWVYHFDDIDFAVQCKVLEDYYKKYRNAYASCLKSFRRVDRKRALPGTATTGNKIVDVEDETKLTPEEKEKRRREKFESTLKRETEALPKDWFVLRSASYVVMSNGGRKFAKEVLNHADAIRGYLDKTFGGVGKDYVPPGIIRIFASNAEQQAYRMSTSTAYWEWAEQVVLSEESSKGRKTWAMEPVSDGITGQWLSFKNRLLNDNLPWWFKWGLERHMRFARVKGKRVTIKPDEYDREYIKDIIKQRKAVPVRTLFARGDDEQFYTYQCGSVITYLMTKGSRGKTKNIIPTYMNNLLLAIEEAEKEFNEFKKKQEEEEKTEELEIGVEGDGESEDEEGGEEDDEGENRWEKFRQAMKEKVKAIREKAFQKTFGHLGDRDWERLNRAWLEYAG
jgi:hypothetical protein